MSRRYAPTARPGLMRWLMVVFTLAGLGLLHSGHCDDIRVPHPAPVSATGHATVLAAEVIAITSQPGPHDHADDPTSPATTVQDCQPSLATAAVSPATATVRAPHTVHGVRVASHLPLPSGRRLPAICLEKLGVSRT